MGLNYWPDPASNRQQPGQASAAANVSDPQAAPAAKAAPAPETGPASQAGAALQAGSTLPTAARAAHQDTHISSQGWGHAASAAAKVSAELFEAPRPDPILKLGPKPPPVRVFRLNAARQPVPLFKPRPAAQPVPLFQPDPDRRPVPIFTPGSVSQPVRAFQLGPGPMASAILMAGPALQVCLGSQVRIAESGASALTASADEQVTHFSDPAGPMKSLADSVPSEGVQQMPEQGQDPPMQIHESPEPDHGVPDSSEEAGLGSVQTVWRNVGKPFGQNREQLAQLSVDPRQAKADEKSPLQISASIVQVYMWPFATHCCLSKCMREH